MFLDNKNAEILWSKRVSRRRGPRLAHEYVASRQIGEELSGIYPTAKAQGARSVLRRRAGVAPADLRDLRTRLRRASDMLPSCRVGSARAGQADPELRRRGV